MDAKEASLAIIKKIREWGDVNILDDVEDSRASIDGEALDDFLDVLKARIDAGKSIANVRLVDQCGNCQHGKLQKEMRLDLRHCDKLKRDKSVNSYCECFIRRESDDE